jgi:hypothetical protein
LRAKADFDDRALVLPKKVRVVREELFEKRDKVIMTPRIWRHNGSQGA